MSDILTALLVLASCVGLMFLVALLNLWWLERTIRKDRRESEWLKDWYLEDEQ